MILFISAKSSGNITIKYSHPRHIKKMSHISGRKTNSVTKIFTIRKESKHTNEKIDL